MVSMRFKERYNDPVIPIDRKMLKTLSAADQERVTKACSYASTLIYSPDPMAEDETQEKKEEAQRRADVSIYKNGLSIFNILGNRELRLTVLQFVKYLSKVKILKVTE